MTLQDDLLTLGNLDRSVVKAVVESTIEPIKKLVTNTPLPMVIDESPVY